MQGTASKYDEEAVGRIGKALAVAMLQNIDTRGALEKALGADACLDLVKALKDQVGPGGGNRIAQAVAELFTDGLQACIDAALAQAARDAAREQEQSNHA